MTEEIKKILINKSMRQLRVACVASRGTKSSKLYDLEIEDIDQDQKVDRICNGEIISIEPSLEAAFVAIGASRNAFLPLKEIAPEYLQAKNTQSKARPNINNLFVGQKVLVQVNKEERGTKGAALTTFISLAGCYLVLMPNNPKAGGISKRIMNEDRDALRTAISQLQIPAGMGVIVRTAGAGRSVEELQWDLDRLVKLWEAIKTASKNHGAPYLIHQESDLIIRTIRDYLRPNIAEIIIDDKETYEKAKNYVDIIRPEFVDKIKLYENKAPLFGRYQIENQIEQAFQRKVRLPSGGEIVIDRSEALTTIDVNSAQATKGGDIEETALHTNLEAAKEIAIQLRIRDLGGLFIIDFIDMERLENKRKIEEYMYEVLKTDRARVQTGRISRFGLLEMSRQRLRPALLNEASQMICPRCHGQGTIRSIQSIAMSIIHLIEEKASKENARNIQLQAPVDLATFLINEYRETIHAIEQHTNISIIIIPNPYLTLPHYELESIGKGKRKKSMTKDALSYELIKTPKVEFEISEQKPITEQLIPAVKDTLLRTATPPPKQHKYKKKPGLLKRFFNFMFSEKPKKKKPHQKKYQHKAYRGDRSSGKYRSGSKYKRKRSGDNYRRSRRSHDKGYRKITPSSKGETERREQSTSQRKSDARKTTHKPQPPKETAKQEVKSQPERKSEPPKQEQKPTQAFLKTKIETPPDIIQVETKLKDKHKDE